MHNSLRALLAHLLRPTPAVSNRPRPGALPRLEWLEERWLPATLTVTTVTDDLTPKDGSVSLREAIAAVNAGNDLGDPDIIAQGPGTFGPLDTIRFNIPGGGQQTILVGTDVSAAASPLPTISRPVTIDGTTQPGVALGPGVVVNGSGAGLGANGLVLGTGGDGSTIKGLVINQFGGSGIVINGTSGNLIQSNYLGTDASGATALPNSTDGVLIQSGASANTVGGSSPTDTNVISGNITGLEIKGSATSGNLVTGNYIGPDASGKARIANFTGLLLDAGANGNTVGGTTSSAINVLSANTNGLVIKDVGTSGNVVLGNFIGTNVNGTSALGNSNDGVFLESGATANTVGGTASGAGNLISANGSNGVEITDSGTSGNLIQGNLIGPNRLRAPLLGNTNDGVLIWKSASANTVGGPTTAANLIDGNGNHNVEINQRFGLSTDNLVQGLFRSSDVLTYLAQSGVTTTVDIATGTISAPGVSNHYLGLVALTIDASSNSGTNGLTVNGTNAGDVFIVRATSVTPLNHEVINYLGMQALTVNGGTGADTVAVLNTSAPTTINTGDGNDKVGVAAVSGALGSILQGAVSVDMGSGANILQLAEAANASADVVAISATQFLGQGSQPFTLNYKATGGTFAGVSLVTGSGADTVSVTGSAGRTGVVTGAGRDVLGVAATSGALGDRLGGVLQLDLGGDANTLGVAEPANPNGDNIVVLPDLLVGQGTSPFVLAYAATGGTLAGVSLVTGRGNDVVAVLGTAGPTGIITGAGNDTVNVAALSGTLGTVLKGALQLDLGSGSNVLGVNQAADTSGDVLTVLANQFLGQGAQPFTITYTASGGSFGSLGLLIGAGADVLNVLSKRPDSPLTIGTGPGDDTVNVGVAPTSAYSAFGVDGGLGRNTLNVNVSGGGTTRTNSTGPNAGVVEVTYPGPSVSDIVFANFAIVHA